LSEKENTSNNANRRATWLELFYDLVFVVVIFQLAHKLEDAISLKGFLGFLALFVPVWWSWIGAVFYATRFDTDDLGHRILVLLQMVGAAFLAVYVSDAFVDGSVGFALSYAAIRIILVLEYVRTGIANHFHLLPHLYDKQHRLLICCNYVDYLGICSSTISVRFMGSRAGNRFCNTNNSRKIASTICTTYITYN